MEIVAAKILFYSDHSCHRPLSNLLISPPISTEAPSFHDTYFGFGIGFVLELSRLLDMLSLVSFVLLVLNAGAAVCRPSSVESSAHSSLTYPFSHDTFNFHRAIHSVHHEQLAKAQKSKPAGRSKTLDLAPALGRPAAAAVMSGAGVNTTASYKIVEKWAGSTFFQGWDFYTDEYARLSRHYLLQLDMGLTSRGACPLA